MTRWRAGRAASRLQDTGFAPAMRSVASNARVLPGILCEAAHHGRQHLGRGHQPRRETVLRLFPVRLGGGGGLFGGLFKRLVKQNRRLAAARAFRSAICDIVNMQASKRQAPLVVFVAADDEYRSEYSLPMLAAILEARHGLRSEVAFARPTPQTNDNIEGLEALAEADLAVLFLRWRALPEEQLGYLLDYVHSGRPVVGLRTSTHAFRYPEGHPREGLNDGFGIELFGQKWIRHHGHESWTRVSHAEGMSSHPILRGVAPDFEVKSWLYVVEPLHGDCERLLIGRAVNPRGGVDHGPQPVAWTKDYEGARVFFTTLGHPEDFQVEAVRRLVVNGMLWALEREIPPGGAEVGFMAEYDPPPAGVPRG